MAIKKQAENSAFLNPSRILKAAGVAYGMNVADLGCGGGYFVLSAARMIGDEGYAYGVDILKTVLSTVESKARMFGLTNVRTVWSNVETFGGANGIEDGSIDIALMIQLLSQSKKHREIFKEASRILKPRGAIVVVDWKAGNGALVHKQKTFVAVESVQDVASAAGFKLVKSFDAGLYHYGLIFQRS